MPDLDLEELKRLVAEREQMLNDPLFNTQGVGVLMQIESKLSNALPELIARVERAEKALRRVAPFLGCIIDYTSGLEYEGNAAAHEVNQALGALTGDTPNV